MEAARAEVPGAKAKGKAAARKAQAANDPGQGSDQAPVAGTGQEMVANISSSQASGVAGQAQAQAELLREATEALKTLAPRAMSKAKKWLKIDPNPSGSEVEGGLCPPGWCSRWRLNAGIQTGLLDSGESPKELLTKIREDMCEGRETIGLVRLWMEKLFPEAPSDLLDRAAAAPVL